MFLSRLLAGTRAVPRELDTTVFRSLKAFANARRHGHGACAAARKKVVVTSRAFAETLALLEAHALDVAAAISAGHGMQSILRDALAHAGLDHRVMETAEQQQQQQQQQLSLQPETLAHAAQSAGAPDSLQKALHDFAVDSINVQNMLAEAKSNVFTNI